MPKFMRSHDDAGETTSVLHDRHTIHLINKAKQSNNSKKQGSDFRTGKNKHSRSPFPAAC